MHLAGIVAGRVYQEPRDKALLFKTAKSTILDCTSIDIDLSL